VDYIQACQTVYRDCPNGYAKSYAAAGLRLLDMGEPEHTHKVQALYILSNISSWRGDTAKAVRTFLKDFSKELR